MNLNGEYPRPLSAREREWIGWLLPSGCPVYLGFREKILTLEVIGEGRRGKGEIILGNAGDTADFSEPLPPVFVYGMIETDNGNISITIREMLIDQVSIEIVIHGREEIPEQYSERRRWTYSTWSPGQACPQCQRSCREVAMRVEHSPEVFFVLAVCSIDKRLWVHESSSCVNRLIPVTNYYNELMLHKGIRNPGIALDSKNLFKNLPDYSDAELSSAFQSYNRLKTKFQVKGSILPEQTTDKSSLKNFIHFFKKS